MDVSQRGKRYPDTSNIDCAPPKDRLLIGAGFFSAAAVLCPLAPSWGMNAIMRGLALSNIDFTAPMAGGGKIPHVVFDKLLTRQDHQVSLFLTISVQAFVV